MRPRLHDTERLLSRRQGIHRGQPDDRGFHQRRLQQAAHLAFTPAPVASERLKSSELLRLRAELCIITRCSDRSASHHPLFQGLRALEPYESAPASLSEPPGHQGDCVRSLFQSTISQRTVLWLVSEPGLNQQVGQNHCPRPSSRPSCPAPVLPHKQCALARSRVQLKQKKR